MKGIYMSGPKYGKARPGYHLVPCDGEAHSNPYIDHCATCMPLWGQVAVRGKYASVADKRKTRREETYGPDEKE